ncbi:hypothetical protein BATDEDRAFT_92407 [Batrachochytrium dendrobatidis JAM81]|uniref:Ribosomal RNA-processing protein 36 n=2 Tax=Batrachochytrium dendrobatidis TaxID=109871 RepID=F4PDH6_BATDJ|nr:uncharacterized protein BATDEDRAFT_92407 [Batrachochytrium dendrobatidis JAM81]EGF76786.1 hypothetical protein BATDEDRAFT_92407 [Batrachochytrium dendrobatidis JAM81]KAK5666887.1 hypothetical protein QVD99_006518 [Batrachochytrium dendrobatidis]OAJ45239.1 hypothetical protein BDEG_28392 [Batrachochytrium dendrobatidis JEL423]|eukprot:XP_006682728.1 hypothetical protein BATDEDRAFT_92407 [Batrachochytrium dendrobatidis JAM81]
MKLVDTLLVLTAAATANAILIPSDNNGSPQASGTSSQVSGPTNKPDSDIFNKKWQEVMSELDLSISNQDQQQSIDESGAGISEEHWQDIVSIINPGISSQDQQHPIGESDPSTSGQTQESSTDKFDPEASEEYWQDIMDIIDSSTSGQDQHSMDQSSSSNTVSNQGIILDKMSIEILDEYKKEMIILEKAKKKAHQACLKYESLRLRQELMLAKGEEISESRHDPKVESQLKKEYNESKINIGYLKRKIKRFMSREERKQIKKQVQKQVRILKIRQELEKNE